MKRVFATVYVVLALVAVWWHFADHPTEPKPRTKSPFNGSIQWETYRWDQDAPVRLTVDTRGLSSEWFAATEYATDMWEKRTNGVIDFHLVTDEWAEDHTSDIRVRNGDYGRVKWVGLAEPTIDYDNYFTHVVVTYNDEYNDHTDKRNVACHELGHAIGLGHARGISSCMLPVSDEHEEPYDTDVNVLEKIYGRLAER